MGECDCCHCLWWCYYLESNDWHNTTNANHYYFVVLPSLLFQGRGVWRSIKWLTNSLCFLFYRDTRIYLSIKSTRWLFNFLFIESSTSLSFDSFECRVIGKSNFLWFYLFIAKVQTHRLYYFLKQQLHTVNLHYRLVPVYWWVDCVNCYSTNYKLTFWISFFSRHQMTNLRSGPTRSPSELLIVLFPFEMTMKKVVGKLYMWNHLSMLFALLKNCCLRVAS